MELAFFEKHYQESIERYQITEEQLRFTGAPIECNLLTEQDPDRFAVLAIENGDLVTYFNLHEKDAVVPYSENPTAILLRAFSTDYRHQGKGYAKQVLQLLPLFVKEHFPHINEIVLGVNAENNAAQHLYQKMGFQDEGKQRMGKKGELIIMSYLI